MKSHLTAFLIGFILDRIIGDPMNFPHPIRLIGSLIAFFDKKLLGDVENKERKPGRETIYGLVMCILTITLTAFITAAVVISAYKLHIALGIAVEAVLTCYILAAKSLKDESMKVHTELMKGTIESARYAVSMIVGRDTKSLDEAGITRATVETIAENTSDGVIAPLIYTFIGGPILGFTYKAVNTMDSMTGYHNDRYEYFGKIAAKLDDFVNYLPARISAFLMILAAYILGIAGVFKSGKKDSTDGVIFSGKNAYRIFKRDRYNHKSPNSAQTESVCAGALGLRLAGDASYFGKIVKKPYIGDKLRQIEAEDIKRAARLMYLTEDICMIILMIIGIILI